MGNFGFRSKFSHLDRMKRDEAEREMREAVENYARHQIRLKSVPVMTNPLSLMPTPTDQDGNKTYAD